MPTFALPYAPALLTQHLQRLRNAPLPLFRAHDFGDMLSPDYCRRCAARPVSYYALFE